MPAPEDMPNGHDFMFALPCIASAVKSRHFSHLAREVPIPNGDTQPANALGSQPWIEGLPHPAARYGKAHAPAPLLWSAFRPSSQLAV